MTFCPDCQYLVTDIDGLHPRPQQRFRMFRTGSVEIGSVAQFDVGADNVTSAPVVGFIFDLLDQTPLAESNK